MTKRQFLTFDQIVSARDLTVKKVDVPEWGGPVYLRELNGRMRNRFAEVAGQAEGDIAKQAEFQYELLASCLCDPDGGPLLEDLARAQELREKNARVTDRLLSEIMEMNGLTAAAREASRKNS